MFYAGRGRYNADVRAAIAAGFLRRVPFRLIPGETRITAARSEVAAMVAEDEEHERLRAAGDVEALATRTNAEAWDALHGQSLRVHGRILEPEIALTLENRPLVELQLTAAKTVMTISSRIALERFKSQRVDALGRLLERIRSEKAAAEVVEPVALVGFDDEGC